jgi:hypothetical protein
METKICSKCGVEKEVCEFYKKPKKENEVRSTCKICMNENSTLYYQKNIELEKEKRRIYSKKYHLNNKITENIRSKNYRNNNLEKVKETQRLSKKKERERNPEKFATTGISSSFLKPNFLKSLRSKKILSYDTNSFSIIL